MENSAFTESFYQPNYTLLINTLTADNGDALGFLHKPRNYTNLIKIAFLGSVIGNPGIAAQGLREKYDRPKE